MANGELVNLTSSVGADGKERPRKTKPKTTYLSDSDVKAAHELPEELEGQVLSGEKTISKGKAEARKQANVEKERAAISGVPKMLDLTG